ncbi:hypothetical protein [Nannocystis pusilla]|uniref:Uncharacterized protein n=1 Tax=Nannocystis pusilla TaxID=889268 RepID=A0ABS7U311_9BACT|nr:hypothetical protein [Nannocystis pusilla]MBZ5714907.1 hypothetical protein [Nannocystis pusilla]
MSTPHAIALRLVSCSQGEFTEVSEIASEPARDSCGRPARSFTVGANLLSCDTAPIRIEAVLRRSGAESAGFSRECESVGGHKSTGEWHDLRGRRVGGRRPRDRRPTIRRQVGLQFRVRLRLDAAQPVQHPLGDRHEDLSGKGAS